MARVRVVLDFDVCAGPATGDFERAKMIVTNEVNNFLHKLVRPENLKDNKILFATATLESKPSRYLFTQNDPEEDSSSDLVEYNLP